MSRAAPPIEAPAGGKAVESPRDARGEGGLDDLPESLAGITTVEPTDTPADLVLHNRRNTALRARYGGITPEERVQGVKKRFRKAVGERDFHDATMKHDKPAVLFCIGDTVVLGITSSDLDPLGGESLDQVGAKIRTAKREEITIPNSVVLCTSAKNYSRLADEKGVIIHTTVSIGYDEPWREVHNQLLLAADRTPGLKKDPKPFIIQTALTDFSVKYQLNAILFHPEERICTLGALNAAIQDCSTRQASPSFLLTACTLRPVKTRERGCLNTRKPPPREAKNGKSKNRTAQTEGGRSAPGDSPGGDV